MIIEAYPDWKERQSNNKLLYYIEFCQHYEGHTVEWTLFQRSFILKEEEYNKLGDTLMSNEGHPYKLGGGQVNQNINNIDMYTKKFLMFMVDGLNKNVKN